MRKDKQLRICVVGAGTRFLSGISYYTLHVANAFARTPDVSISTILMRQLLPTRLYPGSQRVGARLTSQEYDSTVRVFDGVDWYWLPSMMRALLFLLRERPDVMVFQWWSGTVLHSYLLLALIARLLGARVVIEFHEVLDTGEAHLAVARAYVRLVAPMLVGLAQGFVLHSEYDRKLLRRHYALGQRPSTLITHGPYDHYTLCDQHQRQPRLPAVHATCCNLLYFGVIRPYKGLEDLIRAFDALPEGEIDNYRLTIVGETWEGYTLPTQLVEQSRYRNRITLVNHYVSDAEAAEYFAAADAIVLPYHRSSSSGPLSIAMSLGLPVVVTRVGGLIEAVADYEGAILIPPMNPEELRAALRQVAQLRGKRFRNPHSWDSSISGYRDLFEKL